MRKMKFKNLVLLVLLCLFFINFDVFASTKTYERTEDNLQINSRIKVTTKNKSAILKTPKVDETEKIYDFADLFTSSEETLLYTNVKNFIDTYDLDMVIVTIDDNNKASARDYADDFYDYNYFGKNSTCDGLIFLIDMENREMWISTTGEAILVFDDSRIDSILDDADNYISSSKYYQCANAFVSSSSKYASKGVSSSNQNSSIDENGDYIVNSSSYGKESISWVGILVIAAVITLVIILILASKHKNVKKATTAKSYMLIDTFSLTSKLDKFLTTNTTSRYTPRSSGGSSGGSSSHRGSSGISHGGGGRRF